MRRSIPQFHRRNFALLGVLGALILVGCSSASGSTVSKVPDERLAVVPVEGCEKGWTDPTDLSPTRPVARCAPGTPAPKPLSKSTNLTVSIPWKLEFAAPILLANSMGEFAKENLTITTVALPGYDAIPQLAQGQLDASVGGFEVAFFNAERIGLPVRAVMGNYYPPFAGDYSVPQTGLWCRRDAFTDPSNPNLLETQDMTWSTATGKSSVAFFYAVEELTKKFPEFDAERVKTVVLPATESPTALTNGAVDCSVLVDPVWQNFAGGDYVMAATQVPAEPLGFVLFGKSLLHDSPAVGDAFMRAVVRTINTYLTGDYHQNDAVMAQLAADMNQPSADFMKKTPSLVFDWELRAGTSERIQKMFIALNSISTYETPIPDDRLLDRSYYEHVVGKADTGQ